MSGHTPGPWRYGLERGSGDFKAWAVDGICSLWNKEQAEANARLIAAAPELLDTLAFVLVSAEHMLGKDSASTRCLRDAIVKSAKLAIAKATGQ